MKKFTAKIIAIVLSLACVFSFASCSAEVENGSKIERFTITVTVKPAEGEPITYDLQAKMYLNFADFTIEHVKGLIERDYYHEVDVSALTTSYFSFGDRKVDLTKEGPLADPLAERIDANVNNITGQFSKNGYTGNKLTLTQGSILLNRTNEVVTVEGTSSKYNSGKATLTIAFSSAAPFNPNEYCVFAQLVSDDGDKEADSSSDEYLSSVEKALKLKDYIATAEGVKVYRLEQDVVINENLSADAEGYKWDAGTCFTFAKNEEGEETYFKGVYLKGTPENEITGDELSTLKTKLASKGVAITIPVVSIKVSVTLEKQGCAR